MSASLVKAKTISHVTHFDGTEGCSAQESTELNYRCFQDLYVSVSQGTAVGEKLIHTAGTVCGKTCQLSLDHSLAVLTCRLHTVFQVFQVHPHTTVV